jgi:hypothetical protein
MKFGMRISYNQFLVMDQATFNKLTEVLSKSEVRYQNGYGADALFTPDPMEIAIATIKGHQLVDSLPSVETTE